MQRPWNHYLMLARRWTWVVVLGMVICGGSTYVISKLTPPLYQSSAILIISLGTPTSAYDSINASTAVIPTYSQLLTNPTVLAPVLAVHSAITSDQLTSMISVKPQTNTQLIELDVSNRDPDLATKLANEICQSFVQFAHSELPGTVEILPAQKPIYPISPKPLQYTAIGALIGLGLALALIVIFEWVEDRLASPEEVQELLGSEILAVIPRLSRDQRKKKPEEIPALAEECRMLCDTMNAAQEVSLFKMVMVTSSIAGEGKSTIAANLASFLAMADKRVLLVDANLRRPVLDQRFHLNNQFGLSSVFLDKTSRPKVERYVQVTNIPNLLVLTAGPLLLKPAEVLQSQQANQIFEDFKSAPFDYVIFDAPPILPVADGQILASRIQTTVLVVDASKTPRRTLKRSKRVLNRTHNNTVGVAINKSRWSDYNFIRQYLRYAQQAAASNRVPKPPNTLLPYQRVGLDRQNGSLQAGRMSKK